MANKAPRFAHAKPKTSVGFDLDSVSPVWRRARQSRSAEMPAIAHAVEGRKRLTVMSCVSFLDRLDGDHQWTARICSTVCAFNMASRGGRVVASDINEGSPPFEVARQVLHSDTVVK